jgi:hypothetical protein
MGRRFSARVSEREKREGGVVGTCHHHTKKDTVEESEPGSATQRRHRRGLYIRNGSGNSIGGSSRCSRMEISSGSSRRWMVAQQETGGNGACWFTVAGTVVAGSNLYLDL